MCTRDRLTNDVQYTRTFHSTNHWNLNYFQKTHFACKVSQAMRDTRSTQPVRSSGRGWSGVWSSLPYETPVGWCGGTQLPSCIATGANLLLSKKSDKLIEDIGDASARLQVRVSLRLISCRGVWACADVGLTREDLFFRLQRFGYYFQVKNCLRR